MAITNDEINVLRIQAFDRYGPTRMVRLRTKDDKVRFYLCSMKGDRILTVIASGDSYQDMVTQL